MCEYVVRVHCPFEYAVYMCCKYPEKNVEQSLGYKPAADVRDKSQDLP